MQGVEESQITEPSAAAVAKMVGPFRIILRDGTDITPSSELRRAVLAVIVTAEDQTCTRRELISLFWASSEPKKANASLRSALSELRKDLCALGEDCIAADRYSVRLKPRAIAPVLGGTHQRTSFLSGMDLDIRGAEGFEQWLRAHRELPDSSNHDPLDEELPILLASPAKSDELAIGLMPCQSPDPNPSYAEINAEGVIDQFVDLLLEVLPIKLFDYRDFLGPVLAQGRAFQDGNGPKFVLQPRLDVRSGIINLRLVQFSTQEVVWKGDLQLSFEGSVNNAISEQIKVVERLQNFLIVTTNVDEEEILSPYQALLAMFRMDVSELDGLANRIQDAIALEDRPIYHALSCYLATLYQGERMSLAVDKQAEGLRDAARRAAQMDQFSHFNMSMAGYAMTYLLGEIDLGLDLTSQAVEVAPNQAFCWDHFALCLFSKGDFDAAFKAATKAQALGRHSPIRYTYDTTAAIVAFARGDYQSAAQFGNRALFRMPKYVPALRYTTSALSHLNKIGDSSRLARQLQLISPNISTANISQSGHLPHEGQLANRLSEGLKRAGLR